MPDVRPRRNLPPNAEPWGRSVDRELAALQRQNVRQAQDTTNAFKALNSSMSLMASQIAALSELTNDLVLQQAELTETQSNLSEAQADLAIAFSQITTVQANQVTGSSTTNSNGAPIGVGSGGNYVGASVVVPSGFTRAVVTGYSSIRIVGGANMALYLSVNINGNIGPTFPVFAESGSSATTSASAGHAATLTGLSGGQTLTVWGRTTSVSSVTGAYFSNTASFIFLK